MVIDADLAAARCGDIVAQEVRSKWLSAWGTSSRLGRFK
jgi:hypothetical protein